MISSAFLDCSDFLPFYVFLVCVKTRERCDMVSNGLIPACTKDIEKFEIFELMRTLFRKLSRLSLHPQQRQRTPTRGQILSNSRAVDQPEKGLVMKTDRRAENSMNFNIRQQNSSEKWGNFGVRALNESIDLQISMQGASTLAPVPGKARESRKTDVCIPLSHFGLGFRFFSPPLTVTVPLTI